MRRVLRRAWCVLVVSVMRSSRFACVMMGGGAGFVSLERGFKKAG